MSVTINNKFINNPITYKKKLPAFYMTEYNKAEQFFPYAPYDYNVLADVIKRRLLSKYPRDESVKIIKETYKYFSAGKKVTENIELLKNNNTLAIVTGQQPDLMTGPLYIIYKALSAVRLADILNEKFSEYKFVPIFWTASDDHDIEEMNQFALLDQENNFKKFSFNIKAERVPAYRIDFKRQDVFELADFLKNNLRPSEYTERLINELKEVFTRTLNLNQLFILLMQRLFDDFGLIIIDGSNANLRKTGSAIFKREITLLGKLTEIVQRNGALLTEAGFHEQVILNSNFCNIFFEKENRRNKIEYRNGTFLIEHEKYSLSELSSKIDENPELFSPNVILRPVFQDYILPTLVYLGGPGEISYYAQYIKSGYLLFDLQSPIIWPRASGTIIENAYEKIIEKNNLNREDIISGRMKKTDIIELIIKNKYSGGIDKIIEKFKNTLEIAGNDMSLDLKKIDPELFAIYNKSIKPINDAVEKIENRVWRKIEMNEQIIVRQISKLFNNLLPEEDFQERKLNIYYFLNKYGEDFLKILYQSLIIDKPGHNIFCVK